ncbi:hypothetical protein D3C78_1268370 [compost metagenome]
MAQAVGFQDAKQQMAAADLCGTELQRTINPGTLYRAVDMLGQIGNRAGTSRQTIQRLDDIARQLRFIQCKVADHLLQVRLRCLHQLMQPVRQLNVGVTAQLAKRRRTFQRGE